jgi:uncharacterized protein (TIGR02217 family)
MSFDDTLIFPQTISFGATGGPSWLTEITGTGAGLESRNQPNSQQVCKFDVGHAARRQELFTDVAKFYWVARGRLNGFRFKDWTDYNASDNHGVGIFYQLTTTTFQAYKRYTFGSTTYDRKITKLIEAPTITGGSSPSMNLNTGVCTVSGGTPSAWVGTFHVPCRFDIDEAQFQIINKNVRGFILGWQSIPIKEIQA